jgi:hypothetical protein
MILLNSIRFAQRCRELLAIEHGRNPKILELMSPRLQNEIVLGSAGRKSPTNLVTMRIVSSGRKGSARSRLSRILELLKNLVISRG